MLIRSTLASLAVALTASMAQAQTAAPQGTRIEQCIKDNQEEGQTPEAVSSYCSCMSGKMSASETAGVTQWESAHRDTMLACADGAHWKTD